MYIYETHTRTNTRTYIYIYMYVYIYVYMYIYMYIYICTCTCICICINIFSHLEIAPAAQRSVCSRSALIGTSTCAWVRIFFSIIFIIVDYRTNGYYSNDCVHLSYEYDRRIYSAFCNTSIFVFAYLNLQFVYTSYLVREDTLYIPQGGKSRHF